MFKSLKKLTSYLLAPLILTLGCSSIPKLSQDDLNNLEKRNSYYSLNHVQLEKDKFYSGISRVEITPQNNQYLAGYHVSRKATGIHDELFSRCLVLSKNNKTIAFVSLDLLGLQYDYVKEIRELTKKIEGNFINHIVISSTHTHSGPDTMGMWGPGLFIVPFKTGIDKDYLKFLYDKVVESIYRASSILKESTLHYSKKQVPKEKKIARNLHPELEHLIDRELLVLQLKDKNNKTISTLVNYGCHSEALSAYNTLITSDFPNYLNKELEKQLGGISIFFNQTIGGLITPDIDFEKYNKDIPKLYQEAERIGKTLAQETIEALKDSKQSETDISYKVKKVRLPIDNTFFRLAEKFNFITRETFDNKEYLETEINRIDIGDVQIITLPGEFLPNMGQNIKKQMNGKCNFLFGLTNDELGYIMFPEDFDKDSFSYERTMSLGRKTGKILKEEILKLLD